MCSEAERKCLDAMREAQDNAAHFDAAEELRYQWALEKVGPEFVDSLACAFTELRKAQEWRDSLIEKAGVAGFTSGKGGGLDRLWTEAERRAEGRQ